MPEGLDLDGQAVGVGGDECGDLVRGGEQAFPLAAIERDREPAKAVHGQCALVGDFHRQLARVGLHGGDKGEELFAGEG